MKGLVPPKGIHGIMDFMKLQEILNENLTASPRKLQLGRGWML